MGMQETTNKNTLSAGGKISDIGAVIHTYKSLKSDEELFKEKASPLVFYEGMRYKRRRRADCSQDNLRKLLRKGDITEMHIEVLDMLQEFTYLNAFMIRTRLAFIPNRKYSLSTEKCRKLLKNMIEKGLIQQYEFFHKDGEGKEHGSAFIYTLSEGGRKCLKRVREVSSKKVIEFSIENTLRMLAFNQFHILLEKQYAQTNILLQSYAYKTSWSHIGVPGSYQLQLENGEKFFLYVFSVRLNPGWNDSFLYTIRALQATLYQSREESYVLVICETEHHAMECHRFVECVSGVDLPIFYTTDTSVVSYSDVFERLIEGVPGGNCGERTIFSLQLKDE